MRDRAQVLRELSDAARPFELRVEKTRHSELPDLVFIRPTDRLPVARWRFFEPEGERPFMRTVIPEYVSREEQDRVERHLEERVAPVIRRVFSYPVWLSLADG